MSNTDFEQLLKGDIDAHEYVKRLDERVSNYYATDRQLERRRKSWARTNDVNPTKPEAVEPLSERVFISERPNSTKPERGTMDYLRAGYGFMCRLHAWWYSRVWSHDEPERVGPPPKPIPGVENMARPIPPRVSPDPVLDNLSEWLLHREER